jgi:hypothetical protein
MSGIRDHVSELKLRGSYSEVGNTDIGNFPYLEQLLLNTEQQMVLHTHNLEMTNCNGKK